MYMGDVSFVPYSFLITDTPIQAYYFLAIRDICKYIYIYISPRFCNIYVRTPIDLFREGEIGYRAPITDTPRRSALIEGTNNRASECGNDARFWITLPDLNSNSNKIFEKVDVCSTFRKGWSRLMIIHLRNRYREIITFFEYLRNEKFDKKKVLEINFWT